MPSSSASGYPYPLDADPLADVYTYARGLIDGLEAAWTAYTPTAGGGLTIGNGTVVAAKKQIGKTMLFRIAFTLGSTSAIASAITFSLPAAAKASTDQVVAAHVLDTSAGGPGRLPAAGQVNGSTVGLYTIGGSLTATSPFTWATGDKIIIEGSYEIA